jgi:uncharacterized membrane protein
VVFAFLITLVAMYLRIRNLESESVDGDELFSRRVALSTPSAALDLIKDDLVHPPLYYFALKATLPISGASANGIRFFSLVCGVGSIAVLLAWGIAMPSLQWASFLAAGLLAVNSTHIFYSQQARSYALYGLLVCLLILWALVLERYAESTVFWIIGTVLMACVLYTHYVGALFIGAVALGIFLSRSIRTQIKIRMGIAVGVTLVAFAPWLVAEIGVYQMRHGLASNVGWQGVPTAYDLRAIWAKFFGLPRFRGGTLLSLSVGTILISFGILRNFKNPTGTSRRVLSMLFLSAVLPPTVLFATSFPPLNLAAFGERHLLPSIFASLALAAYGLQQISSLLPRRTTFLVLGIAALFSLQIAELYQVSSGPTRQPYAAIANTLSNTPNKEEPVYTTWSYGIGFPVNFIWETIVFSPFRTHLLFQKDSSSYTAPQSRRNWKTFNL